MYKPKFVQNAVCSQILDPGFCIYVKQHLCCVDYLFLLMADQDGLLVEHLLREPNPEQVV